MAKVTVIRVRCNSCEKTVTLVTTSKKKMQESESIGVVCSDLVHLYPSLKGCDSNIVFIRTQGIREEMLNDNNLETIKEAIKSPSEPNPLNEE